MILLPAIDLYKGQAVRLMQGDYRKMTVYEPYALNAALSFRQAGCQWVHLVDLEGARDGVPCNLDTVKAIAQIGGLSLEMGGGIRTPDMVRQVLDAGVSRVILGTAAVENPSFRREMLKKYGDRIAIGVDLRNGFVSVRGWLQSSTVRAEDFLRELEQDGVQTVIMTDISRDGTLSGPNLSLYEHCCCTYRFHVIASGGIRSIEDLKALQKLGVYGAILGKSYYTGAISLKEALKAVC